MPFTDEQPFLDAIFARYRDDEPRFIYADFLDDSGDSDRAALVRVQVALARMTEDHPRHAELINLETELLKANRSRWCDHLNDIVQSEECDFRRGVLDSFVLEAETFLAKGEELFRRVPFRRIRLLESKELIVDLASSPLLANVRELDLCSNAIGNGGVNLLTRSYFLKDLDTLDLGFNDIDDAGVATLARASTLPSLVTLSLSANGQISSAGITQLADSPFIGGLTTLDVFCNDIDDVGIRAIVGSKTLNRLHTLRLSENHIGDAGIAALARSALLERMLTRSSRLEIRQNQIGPAGMHILAESQMLARCTSLDLNHNEIGDAGLAALLRSPHVQNLKFLRLGHNQITDSGIRALRDCWPRFFGQLRTLDLSENRLSNVACQELKLANKDDVVALDVSRNNQSLAGAETANSLGDVVQGSPQGVSEIEDVAALKRRVSHPSLRRGDRPNPRS